MNRQYRSIATLFAFAFLAGLAFFDARAQDTRPAKLTNSWQIKPVLIATASAVDLCNLVGAPPCGRDVYVCWMDAATNSTASTISLADKQSTPVYEMNAVPIAANTLYSGINEGPADQTCRYFPGGVTITVGNANVVSIHMSGKY